MWATADKIREMMAAGEFLNEMKLKSAITSCWMNYFKGRYLAMQFGMPTMTETKSIEPCVELCYELGLDFVELNMNLPEYQVERLDVERLGGIADY
jgi:hypothetical protein